jgi:hypothetical protein
VAWYLEALRGSVSTSLQINRSISISHQLTAPWYTPSLLLRKRPRYRMRTHQRGQLPCIDSFRCEELNQRVIIRSFPERRRECFLWSGSPVVGATDKLARCISIRVCNAPRTTHALTVLTIGPPGQLRTASAPATCTRSAAPTPLSLYSR